MSSSTSSGDAVVPNQGPIFIYVSSVMTALAILFVSYRLTATYKRIGKLGTGDIMLLVSMCFDIITTVIGCLSVNYGFGRHKKDITRSGGDPVLTLFYFWLFQIFYKLVLCFTKLSFLFLYISIFEHKKFRIVNILTIALVVAGSFSMIMATAFQCTPVRKSWEKTTPGHCINNGHFRWSFAVYNTLTDVWVCLLPIPIIARLQMSLSKRLGVIVIFLLGIFVCVTSVLRMTALTTSIASTTDPTWGAFMTLVWSSIEASTGIICACLPSLKQLFSSCVPSFRTHKGGSGKTPHSGTYGMDRLDSKSDVRNIRTMNQVWRKDGAAHEITINGGGARSLSSDSTKSWEAASRQSQERIITRDGITMTTDISFHRDARTPEGIPIEPKGRY